jgi:hypothetical protein
MPTRCSVTSNERLHRDPAFAQPVAETLTVARCHPLLLGSTASIFRWSRKTRPNSCAQIDKLGFFVAQPLIA